MRTSNSQNVQELWTKWKKNHDDESANELINHYMYLVEYHVERVAAHIPSSFDRNDLKSLGLMGLFDALQKFEPERNLKFETYATIRIRGTIMDGLRKEDWLPRTLRDQTKLVEQASQMLEQKLNRIPSAKDIAEQLNMSDKEIEEIMTHALYGNIISLDTTPTYKNDDEQKEGLAEMIHDEQSIAPDRHIIDEELKADLAATIKTLNKNEQLVISLFYHKELTLTEIGEILNLTTSRISQIHKRAIFKLKNQLQKIVDH